MNGTLSIAPMNVGGTFAAVKTVACALAQKCAQLRRCIAQERQKRLCIRTPDPRRASAQVNGGHHAPRGGITGTAIERRPTSYSWSTSA